MSQLVLSRRFIALIVIALLAVAIPLTLFVLSQQQDIRQKAAGQADLVVTGLQLTDAAGNVRTIFGIKEDIYVKVRIKNQGTDTGISSDGKTYTQVYSHKPTPAAPNEVSTDGIALTNGQFNAGLEKTYESRWSGLNSNVYKNKIYFSKSTKGKYTARAYVNFDGKVTENNVANNQEATIEYTVTGDPIGQGVYRDGSISSSPPAGFTSVECGEQGTNNGVTACYALGPVNGKGIMKFTNNSSGSRTVGGGLYRAYYDFPNPYPNCAPADCPEQFIWAWTQTIYAAKTVTLSAGETRYISLPAPTCNWQIDAFIGGEIFLSFHPPTQTYGRSGRLIGGGWLEQYGSLQPCSPTDIPFPTPTPTLPPSTPTPTLPQGVPTPTDTPVPPTETPTPIPPSETPTPTIPVCPLPSQVPNVRIECPFCGQ